MKIDIISIGKFRDHPQKKVFELYHKRISRWNITLKELELKQTFDKNSLKEKESELLLNSCPPSAVLIALDEKGRELSSKQFADLIASYQLNGSSHLNFIIGGADGLSAAAKEKASFVLSLSKMTFPHLMVRALLMEQLYRSYTIITNHPYHRE